MLSVVSKRGDPLGRIPSPPFRHLSGGDDNHPLDLSSLERTIVDMEERRQDAFDLSRQVNKALIACRVALGSTSDAADPGDKDHETKLETIMEEVFRSNDNTTTTTTKKSGDPPELPPREANLSYRMEDYIRYRSFCYFLQTGKLIAPSVFTCPIHDDEYLAGACIGLSRDLEQYALGRATVRDIRSVQLARNVASQIFEQLLQFDFRNGPLRRKYDGTKYAVKTLETILYELSVTSPSSDATIINQIGNGADTSSVPNVKRMKLTDDNDNSTVQMEEQKKEEEESLIPVEEIHLLRKRMEKRDELREALIKRCRDAQKDSKNAIFAIHRGNMGQAKKLLERAEHCITNDLMPIVQKVPALRSSGSYTGVLEEYVEGKLFFHWRNKDTADAPSALILSPQEFEHLNMEPAEYLGGLCDLTGEVGRYAVQCGTARDKTGVQSCLHTNVSIQNAIECLHRLPHPISKKMSTLKLSVGKIERILYELSLVEATGRKNFKADSIRQMSTDQVEHEKVNDHIL